LLLDLTKYAHYMDQYCLCFIARSKAASKNTFIIYGVFQRFQDQHVQNCQLVMPKLRWLSGMVKCLPLTYSAVMDIIWQRAQLWGSAQWMAHGLGLTLCAQVNAKEIPAVLHFLIGFFIINPNAIIRKTISDLIAISK